ncbi:MAG TPA: tripartite tricarboxylate transporter TctB family protein [Candidatus Limnocylindria bacterium]|jgi:hypothetical protein|nr:tripartite tricarboxylate transporter TctB family protein [Candidatus Limnocylindria bacterium]
MSAARRGWDVAFAAGLVLLFAYAGYTALEYPEDARLFPVAVALPGLGLALLQLALSLRPAAAAEPQSAPDRDSLAPAERTRRTLEIAAWIVGIFAAVYLVGFQIAVPVTAVAYMRLAAREGWLASGIVALLCWGLVFGVFDRLLHVPLPTGQLLRLF